MEIYQKASGELLKVVEDIIYNKESAKVSGRIKYNDNFYREVIFKKNSIFGFVKEATGYCYIDENNNIVKDKFLQKNLARIGYFYEIFLNEDGISNLARAVQSDGDLARDKNDTRFVLDALEFLRKEGLTEGEQLKTIVNKVLVLREKTNFDIRETNI